MDPILHPSLNETTSVGGFGFYRERERSETYELPLCHWSGGVFAGYGTCQPLFAPELPDAFRREIRDRSWTGLTARITIAPRAFAYHDATGRERTDPGAFTLFTGPHSADLTPVGIRLEAKGESA